MVGAPPLIRVEIHDYARLHAHLSPFLPESLTILGPYEQYRDHPSDIPIWASFALEEPPPALFAMFMLGPPVAEYQSRLFCSADSSVDEPTPEEEAFIASFMQAGLRAAFEHVAATSAIELPVGKLLVGSIHNKWSKCLHALPQAIIHVPCRKVLLPPSMARVFADSASDARLPPGARVTRLETRDLGTVLSYNKIARTAAYVESRSDQSVCIRAPGPDGEEVPAGWVYVHMDSSPGQLHVVDEFRRCGLGGELMRRAVALRLRREEERAKRTFDEPADMTEGWNTVDVEEGNMEGAGFYGRLPGWEQGWLSFWARFAAPE
ncbi:hypothetical protein FOMPIDRAFT_83284 [Fomitopsis schrenkii]|uniref:N-acetyltransferase domain-containing protein n=1 Tax=Fomitopsis schrenkii TaxID=2126942 RepID=S8G601_FOMSC|nr:hypothetical protein FOMPIDRAFT_83284 [Fomitopsis schrenkii]